MSYAYQVTQLTPHPWGCCECSWEKLRKWAIDNRIVTRLDGPDHMVSTILRLVARMEDHIQDLNGQIETLHVELKEKDSGRY